MEQQGDAELGARLRSTLDQQGRPTQPLDEDLVARILARGVTGRRRRSLAIAGAGLAAALLVAGALVLPLVSSPPPELVAGDPTSTETVAPPSTPTLGPSASPSFIPAPTGIPSPDQVAPPSLVNALPVEGVLAGLTYDPNFGQVTSTTRMALIMGAQICDATVVGDATGAVSPSAAVNRMATSPDGGTVSADFTISLWPDDIGWSQIVQNSGSCRWFNVAPGAWPGAAANPDKLLMIGGIGADAAPGTPVTVAAAQRVTLADGSGTAVVASVFRSTDEALGLSEATRISDLMASAVNNPQVWDHALRGQP